MEYFKVWMAFLSGSWNEFLENAWKCGFWFLENVQQKHCTSLKLRMLSMSKMGLLIPNWNVYFGVWMEWVHWSKWKALIKRGKNSSMLRRMYVLKASSVHNYSPSIVCYNCFQRSPSQSQYFYSLWREFRILPFSPGAPHGSQPSSVEVHLSGPDHKRGNENTGCAVMSENLQIYTNMSVTIDQIITSKCLMKGAMPLYGWLWCFSWGSFSSCGRNGIGSRGAKRASRFGGKNCVILHLNRHLQLLV